MKKFFVFLSALACLPLLNFVKIQENPLFDLENVKEVCFVSENEVENARKIFESGGLFYNYCSLQTAKELVEELNVEAIQFYIEDYSFEGLKELLKMEELLRSYVDGMEIICGYTPYYAESVYIDGKKVNVQIVIKSNQIVSGFPMLLTGY